MLQVCKWESDMEQKSKSGYSHMLKSLTVVLMFVKVLILVIFEDELKSFEPIWEMNMNSEEIHTEGLPLFPVVSTQNALAIMCKISQKEHHNNVIFVFCLSLSLYLSLSRTHILCQYYYWVFFLGREQFATICFSCICSAPQTQRSLCLLLFNTVWMFLDHSK